jgi:glycosyltransferase involved in cell wall biosynthesis
MKILVLTSTYPRWKDDTEPGFVDQLSQNLAQEHAVDVIAPHARGAAMEESMGNVHVHRFRYSLESWQTLAYDGGILPNLREQPVRWLLVPSFLLCQWLLAVRLLRRNRYDIIHAHWIIPQGLVAILARGASGRKPALVITSHGGDLFALKGKLLSRVKRWITRRADALTVVSAVMKQKAAHMGLQEDGRIANIPMGVDTRQTFLPPADAAGREGLLFVGRLVDKKGVDYLLRAMPRVLARFPDQHLTIIGDGPLRRSLEELCRELNITGRVTMQGSLVNRDIPPFLQGAAITIFPSIVTDAGDQEGSPVAVMEALASGCAVIVADYPGAGDIVDNGTSGLIVPGRSSDAIAEAILALLDNPDLCRTLGGNGRQRVQEHYDWAVISSKFSDVFRQVATG